MPFFISTTIALAALASGAHALSEPMSSADADTLVAKLTGYTAMYESLAQSPVEWYLNVDGTKGTTGVAYCTKVAESWAALKCSEFDASTCTGDLSAKPCCEGQNQVKKKCEDMSEDWRLAEAKKFKSDATSGDCCPDCLLAKDTNEYKARCTTADFVGATVCATNGKEDDARVYMPGPPIAWKKKPVDCSTGPTHEVRFLYVETSSPRFSCRLAHSLFSFFFIFHLHFPLPFFSSQMDGRYETDCEDGEKVDGECPKKCYASQAGFDAVDKIFQAGGYKDYAKMSTEEEAAWKAISGGHSIGIVGMYPNAVVSGSADATAKAALTANVADGCLGLLSMPTMGESKLTFKKGSAYVYKPTVLAGAAIDVSPATGDSVKVTILGGSSKGKVIVTNPGASSSFYIHDLVNEEGGDVTITGIKDGFISKVTNKGTFVATDTIGSAVGIINEGKIQIKGTSNINLIVTSNTGTIELGDDVKGTLSVPKDQMSGIKAPAGVAVTETAATSLGSGPSSSESPSGDSSTAALASGVVAMALVAASFIF